MPIPDIKVREIQSFLKASSHQKYSVMFDIGLETGLRISDILRLEVSGFRQSMRIVEQKTGKERRIKFSSRLYKDIQRHIASNHLKAGDFLVFRDGNHKSTSLSRVQAYKTMKCAAVQCGVENIGTHSLRKTFAVNHFKKHRDMAALQKILNHKYITTTMLYVFNTKNLSSVVF